VSLAIVSSLGIFLFIQLLSCYSESSATFGVRFMEYGKGRIEWLEFDLLEPYPHVIHGVFLRHGGTSSGKFATLNLSEQVGDHPDSVKVNRETVRKMLSVPKIVYANQVHGAQVHRVTAQMEGKLPPADALWTTEKGVGLAVTHADCQAALFFDPVRSVIAIAHAGWKGTLQNIYGQVVATLQSEAGSDPRHLLAAISPSLGPDHAEFMEYRKEFPQEFWEFQTTPHHFDFWAISKMQLTQAGLLEKNIEISAICTHCYPNDYFSYRRDRETGRNATIVALAS
jgi:YfiH family protein